MSELMPLSDRQVGMLLLVRWAGRNGHFAKRNERTLNALFRRGLVTCSARPMRGELYSWQTSQAGRDWVAREEQERLRQ